MLGGNLEGRKEEHRDGGWERVERKKTRNFVSVGVAIKQVPSL